MTVSNQEALSSIPSRDLEEFISSLWSQLGWETSTTEISGDDGVDVVATREEPYEQKKLIQVKQRGEPLSRRHAQQYSYLHHKPNVDEVLLVSTAGFTEGARESAKEANVKLIGPDTILSLIDDTDAFELLERYTRPDLDLQQEPDELDDSEKAGSKELLSEAERAQFFDIAASEEVFAILSHSVPSADRISPAARLAIIFQLFRGENEYHSLLIGEAGDRATELLEGVVELHELATYVNGITADPEGLIGRYNSAGRTHEGVFTKCQNGIVAIDRVDKIGRQEFLIEPLERQTITVTKADHHHEYDADISCLASCSVKYGKIDQFEPLAGQIPLDLETFELFDAKAFVEKGALNSDVPPDIIDPGSQDMTPLTNRELATYAKFANREFPNPVFSDKARQKVKEYIADWNEIADFYVSPALIHSLYVSAQAGARARLSDTTTVQDVELASSIVTIRDLAAEQESFDADVIETGTAEEQRERIKSVRSIIRSLEGGYEAGAPIEEIYTQASDLGLAESLVEHEIEKLRDRGEVYEPATDHLRTT